MNTYRYQPEGLVETTIEEPVLVADSFLLVDGKVRSFDLHLDRFQRGIALKAPELVNELPKFITEVRNILPKEGSWFPRIELTESKQLLLKVRPAPEIFETAVLWTYPHPDPRADLTVKGPELALGATIRDQAVANKADEAVFLNKDGFISEGALSSLIWFKDGVLHAPNNQIPWLESVTRTEIMMIAKGLGIQTKESLAKPEDLIDSEIWILSSLQGIRRVTSWIGVSDTFKDSDLKSRFELELTRLEQDLV